MYRRCVLCEHRCEVDRSSGPAGVCAAGALPRIFCELTEYAEEPEFLPCYAVSFSGCNLRCNFCITGASSQNASVGETADIPALAERIQAAVARGARSVMLLGGEATIFLPLLEQLVARLGPLGVPLVLNTNLYCTPQTLARCLDLFDVILADFKFGNNDCARRLAGVPRYVEVLQRNLELAAARRRVITRHLVMPGHDACCRQPVTDWVRSRPQLNLSLRDHFVSPAPTLPADGSIRFHVDRQGRILIENFDQSCFALEIQRETG